jgi:HK97 family phage portal protein
LEKRSLFARIFGRSKQNSAEYTRMELINSASNSFYAWDKQIFESDIVRAAIRPKANAVGKLNAKHIRGIGESMKINPDASLRTVLEQPNPFMSMQDLLCKLTFQREINHNAFAYVKRDDFGYPVEIYPLPYSSVEIVEKGGGVFLKFWFAIGKYMHIPYEDVIHLRKDFNEHDIYGDTGTVALTNIMEVINTTDQGIVKAVKNSAIIKWILMFKSVLQPKDREMQVAEFVKNYLSIDTAGGAAASDPRYELKQVEDKNYVPNAAMMKESTLRLYAYFGVNENIVQNKYTEDEWNAFYESEIEPIIIQLSNAFTKAFFSARERGFGNKIVFESNNLQYASMQTKLGLVQMVDRGALTPNEWREVMNLTPIEGGDKPLRRLDTVQVDDEGGDEDGNKPNGEDREPNGKGKGL